MFLASNLLCNFLINLKEKILIDKYISFNQFLIYLCKSCLAWIISYGVFLFFFSKKSHCTSVDLVPNLQSLVMGFYIGLVIFNYILFIIFPTETLLSKIYLILKLTLQKQTKFCNACLEVLLSYNFNSMPSLYNYRWPSEFATDCYKLNIMLQDCCILDLSISNYFIIASLCCEKLHIYIYISIIMAPCMSFSFKKHVTIFLLICVFA